MPLPTDRPDIVLVPTRERDLDDLRRLWNDGRVMRWVGYPAGLGYDDAAVQAWFEWLEREPECHHFVIRAEGLGFCGEAYYAYDVAHRRAALDIKLVPEAQGRGVATAALTSLVSLVFRVEPGVDAVWVEPSPRNRAARRLYRRVGLKPRRRPAELGQGTYWEVRREEWPGLHSAC